MTTIIDILGFARDLGIAPRRVNRLVRRAIGGCRLDDAIRGDVPLACALWLLSRLVRDGRVIVGDDGWIGPRGHGRTTNPAVAQGDLIDPYSVNDLIDWPRFEGVLAARPYEASAEYSQSFDTVASLRRRLAMMEYFGDLSGHTILQLGDDELFSVALAMVDDVRHVYAIDADERILKAIQATATEQNLPLSTERVDVLRERTSVADADRFYISGLKDAGGLTLFMACAIAATSEKGAAGYVSFDVDVYQPGASERQALEEVYRAVARMDCVITALLPGEDLLLSDDLLAKYARVVAESAAAGDPPDGTAERLKALATEPGADLLVRKQGYPNLPLRPLTVMRIETGPTSARSARRIQGFMQRAAASTRG
jgi:hypothetical protein